MFYLLNLWNILANINFQGPLQEGADMTQLLLH